MNQCMKFYFATWQYKYIHRYGMANRNVDNISKI